MNVVTFDPKEKELAKRKSDMLEVLDSMREGIESGYIKEFVAASLGDDGIPQIYASCLDLTGGIGLFEIGKTIMIDQAL